MKGDVFMNRNEEDLYAYFREMNKEQKKAEKKAKRAKRLADTTNFVKENQTLIYSGVGVLGAASGVVKKLLKNHAVNKEIKFKETTIYDRSLGRYVRLKKKLTAEQALKIEQRKNNGEKLHLILKDMNLLKDVQK